MVTRWRYWYGIGLAIHRSRGPSPALAASHSSLGQATYTCVVSVTKQYNLVPLPAKGQWCCSAGKITAGLQKVICQPTAGFMTKSSAGWLPRDRDQLRAQRSLVEYGTTLPYYCTLHVTVIIILCRRRVTDSVNHPFVLSRLRRAFELSSPLNECEIIVILLL